VLLVEKPEHLEKLGILERSAPIRKEKPEDAEQELEPVELQPEPPEIAAGNEEKVTTL
jgi:hypothetical protein